MKKEKMEELVGKFSQSFGFKEISDEYASTEGAPLSISTIRPILTRLDASKKCGYRLSNKDQALFHQLIADTGERISASSWAASYGFDVKQVLADLETFKNNEGKSEIVDRFLKDFGPADPSHIAPLLSSFHIAPAPAVETVSVAGSLSPTASNLLNAALVDNTTLRTENEELWKLAMEADVKAAALEKKLAEAQTPSHRKGFLRTAVRKIEQVGSAIKLIISHDDTLYEEISESLAQGDNVSTELMIDVSSIHCKA